MTWTDWLSDDLEVSLDDFVTALHPDVADGEVVLLERLKPGYEKKAWGERTPRFVERNPGSWYTPLCTVRDSRPPRRRKQDARTLRAVFLDDVGSKVETPPELAPSCILESSPGNFQWLYFVEGYDVANPDHAAYFDALFRQLVEKGYTDEGAEGVNRIVRVPGSLNMKEGREDFAARIRYWDPTARWNVKDLARELGLTVNVDLRNARAYDVPAGIRLPTDVVDPVLRWLEEQELVTGEGDDFYEVVCPNHEEHTDGAVTAGFSPLGHGGPDRMMYRQFHCFHAHCQDFKSTSFLRWVGENGGPGVENDSPIDLVRLQHAYVDKPQGVADLSTGIHDETSVMPVLHFERKFALQIPVGERAMKGLGRVWLEHPQRNNLDAMVFRPGQGIIFEESNRRLYNTWRAPEHPPAREEPRWFLDHVRHIVPDEVDQELFFDWLACKVQYPAWRSYAIAMVAQRSYLDEDGQSFGIGRSGMMRALRRVFQNGVHEMKLRDLISDSGQAQYNDWLNGAQILFVNETRAPEQTRAEAASHYEHLKLLVDTQPALGIRVNHKFVQQYRVDVYANFLFFTNHFDALPLPADDRRFHVIQNATIRRTLEEYGEFESRAKDLQSCADLYWWLRQRPVQPESDRLIYPEMTAAKARMIQGATSQAEQIVRKALAELPGHLVTQSMLKRRVQLACDHGEVVSSGYLKRVWEQLDLLDPDDPKARIGNGHTSRKTVRLATADPERVAELRSLFRSGAHDALFAELEKNAG